MRGVCLNYPSSFTCIIQGTKMRIRLYIMTTYMMLSKKCSVIRIMKLFEQTPKVCLQESTKRLTDVPKAEKPDITIYRVMKKDENEETCKVEREETS